MTTVGRGLGGGGGVGGEALTVAVLVLTEKLSAIAEDAATKVRAVRATSQRGCVCMILFLSTSWSARWDRLEEADGRTEKILVRRQIFRPNAA